MNNLKKIVFGSWPISGDYSSNISENKSLELLNLAYKNGINEFDTAPNYGCGKSEYLIGEAFKKFKKKPKINTKIGNNHNKVKSFNLDLLKKTFNKSLKNLKIKKINILFLHNPQNIKNQKKIINYLKKLKKNKKINDYGLSLSKEYKYSKKFLDKFKIIQLDHNIIYLDSFFSKNFFNKNIYARSPFASGTIFLDYRKKYENSDFRSKWLSPERKKIIISQIKFLKKIYKIKILDLSIYFLLNDDFVNKIIFGFKNLKQLKVFLKIVKKTKKDNFNSNEFRQLYKFSTILNRKGF